MSAPQPVKPDPRLVTNSLGPGRGSGITDSRYKGSAAIYGRCSWCGERTPGLLPYRRPGSQGLPIYLCGACHPEIPSWTKGGDDE